MYWKRGSRGSSPPIPTSTKQGKGTGYRPTQLDGVAKFVKISSSWTAVGQPPRPAHLPSATQSDSKENPKGPVSREHGTKVNAKESGIVPVTTPSFPPSPSLVRRYPQRRAFRCSRFPRNTYERLRLVILRRDFSSNQGAASERSRFRERAATQSWRKRSRIGKIQRASAYSNRPIK